MKTSVKNSRDKKIKTNTNQYSWLTAYTKNRRWRLAVLDFKIVQQLERCQQ